MSKKALYKCSPFIIYIDASSHLAILPFFLQRRSWVWPAFSSSYGSLWWCGGTTTTLSTGRTCQWCHRWSWSGHRTECFFSLVGFFQVRDCGCSSCGKGWVLFCRFKAFDSTVCLVSWLFCHCNGWMPKHGYGHMHSKDNPTYSTVRLPKALNGNGNIGSFQ